MVEDESITEDEDTGSPDQYVGRDLLESYIYYLNYVASNPIERYGVLVKSVTFGMELLPFYDNPAEADPDTKQVNKENQDRVNAIYANAEKVLREEVPSKREITYDYVDAIGGDPILLYKIKSSEDKDAKPCQALEKELSTVLNNFITQQHEQHIPKLQMAHNRILHELTQAGIVPSINPTRDQIVDEKIKSIFRGLCQPEYEENEEATE